ncbi:MAG TPA: hypothetical protein VFA44_05245 [Gaiellaceae bacterium]|nr:hypothetical protein [Gaiellaceae bacterium]HZT54142.1 hypothetical protein [Gaiellaceae bacterium]
MRSESSPPPAAPSIDLLRGLAAQQGVFPTDEDLTGVLGFLEVILPSLVEIERRLPPETAP